MTDADISGIRGRRILVVGGTRGIGRAISLHLACGGARVTANYVRSAEAAQGLQHEARAANLQVSILRADVSLDKGREELAAAVRADGPLHGLVFAAASGVHRALENVSARHFDFVFATNVRAFLFMVQDVLPAMAEGGSIIALSSEGAERVMPDYGLVSASKAALESICRQYAVELAPRGIRCNILSPGAVVTDAWKALPHAEERLAAAASRTPRGELVSFAEVASAAQFLLSDASAGINGQCLVVDAGARIRGSG